MDSLFLCIILLLAISLVPHVLPIFTFLVCFYIGFKLICKDLDTEMALRNYLARKMREFIDTIRE